MFIRTFSRGLKTAATVGLRAQVRIPPNVEVTQNAQQLVFKGPLGISRLALDKIDSQGIGALRIAPDEEGVPHIHLASLEKAFLGTVKSLVQNKLHGVTRGYLIYLRVIGVGYRASLEEGQTLVFKVGFSHDVKFTLPPAIRAFLPEPTLVCLYGIDKNQVTQVAADIRAIKPPDAYKGKGIRLANEVVKTKSGKKTGKK